MEKRKIYIKKKIKNLFLNSKWDYLFDYNININKLFNIYSSKNILTQLFLNYDKKEN